MALPKDGCPLLVCWGFSPTHKIPQTTVHQSLTEELTTCFALPCQRKSSRGDDGTLVETSNVWSVFLSLYKLNRSANVTSMWTLQIYIETLVCRWKDGWMDGAFPPLDTSRGRDSVWTLLRLTASGHKSPWDQKSGRFFFPLPQSNNQKTLTWQGWHLLHPCALSVVPWWTHSQLVHFRFDLPLLSTSTPYRLRSRL